VVPDGDPRDSKKKCVEAVLNFGAKRTRGAKKIAYMVGGNVGIPVMRKLKDL